MNQVKNNEYSLENIQSFKGAYPKQLFFLFMTEMWERFCFYGMRGMLTIFIATRLLSNLSETAADQKANLQYGAIQAFVYAFTFIGGLFADKILGFRKSLYWGGLLMIIGNFIIAVSPEQFFYAGICCTIVGTGFFKPNISTMVGGLYKQGDSRRDAGFGLFYSGINIGAFLGGLVCVWIGKYYSWSMAFGSAGIAMIIGLITFALTQKTLGPLGQSPLPEGIPVSKKRGMEIAVYIGSLIVMPFIMLMVTNTTYTDRFMAVIGPAVLLYLIYEMTKLNSSERKKMVAALVFILFSVVFWAIFEQAGGSLSIFALKNLHSDLLGVNIDPNIVNNTANSVFVIAFSPLIGIVWLALARRKADPNTVVKFGIAFLFMGLAYYLYYYSRNFADASGKTSLGLFTIAYLVISIGELCLSPIGLSIMTKLSPRHLWGMMMGMWFLASAYGQYIAGLIGAQLAEARDGASNLERLMVYTSGYKQLAIYAAAAGVLMILISPVVKKLMQEVK